MTTHRLITGRLSSIEDRIAAELPGPDDAAMLIDLAAELDRDAQYMPEATVASIGERIAAALATLEDAAATAADLDAVADGLRINQVKAPFPWFGGKADAAEIVWAALGDVAHYVEPMSGSLAVLLRRPHLANRTYYSETVNDADGLLVNAWRSIQRSPQATAEYASWPVTEADNIARELACLAWIRAGNLERLMASVSWHDPEIAGYWLYGISCRIGSGYASGDGPWVVGDDGRLTKRAGREPGVARQLPHVGDNGRGVNHAGLREPGVSRQLPHVADDGRGVNRPQLREPGVARQFPHVGDDGKGVNHAGLREPGVNRKLPHVGDNGTGVNRPQLREPGVGDEPAYHPMTMPQLRQWFAWLSARLRHVRVLNGDWRRACTSGVLKTLPVRQAKGICGVFLDPPYSTEVRAGALYTHDGGTTVAADVRAWCLANGDDPQYRIVLAGFAGEGHEELEAAGWRSVEWFKSGFLKGGMAQQKAAGHQQHRERLWLSPHCLRLDAAPEPAAAQTAMSLWDDDE